MTDEMTTLRAVDPTLSATAPTELDDRAQRDLLAIISTPSGHKLKRRGGWGAAAGLAVAMVIAAVILGLPDGAPAPRAYAATPPLLAVISTSSEPALVLNDLAARAQRANGTASTVDQVIRTQSWSLFTRVDGKTVNSAVIPVESELRWGADRSGTLKRVTGQPYFPNPDNEHAWLEDGRPARPGTMLTSETYALGDFKPMWNAAPPTDPRDLAEYLAIGHPIERIGTAELFVAIGDLARERDLSAVQRAAVLRILAKAPDMNALGTVIDRLGRPGIAVATDSDYSGLMTRYILVFDPNTGALNAEEAWLTTSAGRLNVPVPSVISYTAWKH
ncbi:CU044_5270 family protein [Knoellia sp. p5-6-4]|uniref:CU044_5270 family protein n=1 Tax=unclassified Knoellia TaxID=2618719 RepID=UPI0023DAA238|nr:CU044_5270 family protein [Knoellia sp. p5-6-4]MDF2146950.1 CU044_5270 family protein [Knoellia sp. p5-6-4]